MNILIVKLGATGDVVRTTPLLRRFTGNVTWVTARKNKALLENFEGRSASLRALEWEDRARLEGESVDLAINLEDDPDTAAILETVRTGRVFGAFANDKGTMCYTPDASKWYDLSLISVHGREKADELKFLNRRSYQELIFEGLGLAFTGDR